MSEVFDSTSFDSDSDSESQTDVMKDYIIVSNSESQSWNSCRRRYYYEYDRKLSPIAYSGAIGIGVAGHAFLEAMFLAEKEGRPYHEIAAVLEKKFSEMYADPSYDKESLFKANELVVRYDSIFNNVGYEYGTREVLSVETNYFLYLGRVDSVRAYLPFKIDVVIRDQDGKVVIWDHKFVYNFYDTQKIQLSPQFQKYTAGYALIEGNESPIGLLINQIRTRPLKNPTVDQSFNRELVPLRPYAAGTMLKEHVDTVAEILQWRRMPIPEREKNARRVYHPMVCNGCSFVDLCISDLTGGNTDAIIESGFKKNEYGYKAPQEIVDGTLV